MPMMIYNHPCKQDCPDRSAECKKTCSKWAESEAKKFADYERRRKLCKEDTDVVEAEIKRYRRTSRYGCH